MQYKKHKNNCKRLYIYWGDFEKSFALYFYVKFLILCFLITSAGIYTAAHPAATGYVVRHFSLKLDIFFMIIC